MELEVVATAELEAQLDAVRGGAERKKRMRERRKEMDADAIAHRGPSSPRPLSRPHSRALARLGSEGK
jgi:hypothetical protein